MFTTYGGYGVGKFTELDLTLFGVGTKKFRDEILGLGFKTSIPLFKSKTKLTFGHLIPISLRGNGVGGYSYSHLSTILPKIKTRVTAGALIGTTTILGKDTVCFIGGIEQPITKKFNLLADWTSGKHASGLLILGASYNLSTNSTLYLGYQIPNNFKVSEDGFVIELIKFF